MCTTAFAFSPVYAAERTLPDYDPDETGTITLYKYVNNDGASTTTNGSALAQTPDQQLDAVEQEIGSYNMIPEEGVVFKYLKTGEFEQIDDPENDRTGVYFTHINEHLLSAFAACGVTLTPSADTAAADAGKAPAEMHYAPEAIYTAMEETNRKPGGEDLLRAVADEYGTAFSPTDYYGRTKSEQLPVGMYLVAEVDWEHQTLAKHDDYWIRINDEGTEDTGDGSDTADIVSPSSPFIVHIPIALEDKWLYDVTAYPKNGTLNIHKDILVESFPSMSVYEDNSGANEMLDTEETETLCEYRQLNYSKSNGGEYIEGVSDDTMLDGAHNAHVTHQRDANIGDTVVQLISSDVPALVGEKKNKTYRVSDNMTKGLKFKRIESVMLSQGAYGTGQMLSEGTDYTATATADGSSFTVELTEAGLLKLDAVPSASYLYITFQSTVTKDALIGTDTYPYLNNDGETVDATNQNTAMLTYATDRTTEHDYYSNTCRIYTYEIDLEKTLSQKIRGVDEGSAVNRPVDYSEVKFTVKATGDGGHTTKPVVFTKETDGVYHIYDAVTDGVTYDQAADSMDTPAAVTQFIQPDNNGHLVLKGLDSRDYEFTEVATAENYQLLTEPFTVRLMAATQTPESIIKQENGTLSHAYVWSGEEQEDLRAYDLARTESISELNRGRVPVRISNTGIFHILRTGGSGTYIFIGLGGALLIAAGSWLWFKNKKDNDEEVGDKEGL